MNEQNNTINGYDKLSPQRQILVDKVIENIKNGNDLWKQGWKSSGLPESATTGKPYRGMNNFFLTLVGMSEGYTDNRWATYHQIEENGWKFKTDEEGKSLAKGKSAPVEFYELRDRETKKPYDKSVLIGMTQDEKDEYIEKNVYPLRKFYRVFNADLIEGIPAKEISPIDEKSKSERVEKFIKFWGEKEAPIFYGGGESYYSYKKDEIHLPERKMFDTAEAYYSTALHEIGHSTGHSSRLNRKLDNSFGSKEYAIEELRAEIASIFMEQDFDVNVDESAIRNNSAYVKAWLEEIKEDPNVLFKAITDADRIAKFVKEKDAKKDKRVEYFAVVREENEVGDNVYKVYMTSENGQTSLAIDYGFTDKEALLKEFDNFKEGEFWKDAEFEEVPFDKLEEISIKTAENQERKEEIKQEKSKEYIRPSEIAAMAVGSAVAVDMTTRGIESLSRISDKDVVEKASNVRSGDTFKKLYNGEKLFLSEDKNEEILMMRISMFCNGDKERALRVFKSSGQFRDDKPNSYYMKMVENVMNQMNHKQGNTPKLPVSNKGNRHFGFNAKG